MQFHKLFFPKVSIAFRRASFTGMRYDMSPPRPLNSNTETPAIRGSEIFSFGKHRSKTFLEVATNHSDYVQWALNIPNPTGQLKDFIAFLSASSPSYKQNSAYPHPIPVANIISTVSNACEPFENKYSNVKSIPVARPKESLDHLKRLEASRTLVSSHTNEGFETNQTEHMQACSTCFSPSSSVQSTDRVDTLGTFRYSRSLPTANPSVHLLSSTSSRATKSSSTSLDLANIDKFLKNDTRFNSKPGLAAEAVDLGKAGSSLLPAGNIALYRDLAAPTLCETFHGISFDEFAYAKPPKTGATSSNQGLYSSSNGLDVLKQDQRLDSTGHSANLAIAGARSSSTEFFEESSLKRAKLNNHHDQVNIRNEAPIEKQTLDCAIAVELISPLKFRIVSQKASSKRSVPQKWLNSLPGPVWKALMKLDPIRESSSIGYSAISFPAEKYSEVCFFISQNFDCTFERIPNFVLRSFSNFVGCASPLSLPRKTANILMGEVSPYTAERRASIRQHLGQELQQQLKPFQVDGVQFGLRRNGRVLIGDEMGLGKTVQALAIAAYYCEDWPLLVVCPSSIRYQWRDQALRWLPHKLKSTDVCVVTNGKTQIPEDSKVVIISYDLISLNEKFQRPYKSIICDESHYLKNTQAKRTQVLSPIVRHARRAVLLSGTPALNKPIELFPQIAVLLPEFGSYQEFASRYCEKQLNWYTKHYEYTGYKHVDELHLFLKNTIMIRRLKKEVQNELPPKIRSRIPIEVSEKEMREIRVKMKEMEGQKETCNSLLSDSSDSQSLGKGQQNLITELFVLTSKAKMKGAADYISYLIQSDCKFLVFAHHLEMLDVLEKQVIREKVQYIRIDGRTPLEKRHIYIKEFQEDTKCQVAILSITACGQGLNLTAAGTVVFAELYWVPGQMIQAEDRSHRIGTEYSSVAIHYLIAENTLDENVWRMLVRKWGVMTSTLDGNAESLSALQLSKGSMPSV